MFHLSIRSRIILIGVALGIAGVAAQSYGFASNAGDITALRDRSAALLALQENGHQLVAALHAQHDAVNNYLFTHDPGELAAYDAATVAEAEAGGAASTLSTRFPGASDDITAMRAAADTWRREFVTRAVALMQSGTTPENFPPALQNLGVTLYEQVRQLQAKYDTDLTAMYAATVDALGVTLQTQTIVFVVYIVGVLVGIGVATGAATRWLVSPLAGLLRTAQQVRDGRAVAFESKGDDEIGRLGGELERMRSAMQRQADEGEVVNRFTELTAFVDSDGDIARATLDALAELVRPLDGVIHISNRSRDRALPEASIGSVDTAVIPLGQLNQCPGVRRSARYVTSDLSGFLAVRCPLYPASTGTLACIPLIALGDVIGAVHLHWSEPDALHHELTPSMSRITDHASLSIANRRLVVALQGQASTDGRTGLPNSRAFDEALERALAARSTYDPLAVLMLDIDHFKAFNDRNGHPAGDQALRAFAAILGASVRDGDLAARYGGEEFVVMLPGASPDDAVLIAERIRQRTEDTVIELSPGHRDQVTVSIGVAAYPDDAGNRVDLLEAADAALYRAKDGGRNRWALAGEEVETRVGPVAVAEAQIAAALADVEAGDDAVAATPDADAEGAAPAAAAREARAPEPLRLPRAG